MQVATPTPHISVMPRETLKYLTPADGEIYIDGTFGAGGHSRAILDAANCHVIAFDQDESVKPYAEVLEKHYPGRFELKLANFSQMEEVCQAEIDGFDGVNGVLLDIGVSSMQLDQADRGFSFQQDGPLDMRMGSKGMTAADCVNQQSEAELANIIYRFGDERKSRRIAKAIVTARQKEPIERTLQLRDIIHSVIPKGKSKIDPATKTFQAIRIWINDELEALRKALDAALNVLKPGGRLVVITFHSLEDKMVKDFLRKHSGKRSNPSRHSPLMGVASVEQEIQPALRLLNRKAVTAEEDELQDNVRARSAKLRAAIKNITSSNKDNKS